VHRRTYYAHLLDLLNRSFNTAFLTRWAQHYSRFGEDMTGSLSYLNARAQYARNVLNGTGGQIAPIPPVPFRITTPSPLTVGTPFATIVGDAWIDVAEIRLLGSPEPLAVTWTDDNSYTLQLPIRNGTHEYTLAAFSNLNAQLGTASITITGTGGIFPAGPGDFTISELHFNPSGDTDATEFIELLNLTGTTLDLGGCHFDEELGQGVAYTFPADVQVPAGGRILIARDRSAFIAAYPTAGPLAPGQFTGALDNNGETLVLYAASGLEIFRITYTDDIESTDGGGRSLVRVLSSTNPDGASNVWRASGTDGGNPGSTDALPFTGSALADLDTDGLAALLEYALGTSDLLFTAQPRVLARNAAGQLEISFSRGLVADDAALVIEAAATPAGPWMPATATLLTSTPNGNVAVESWRITPPAPGDAFFVRLRATAR
jgi:hypothetical protein